MAEPNISQILAALAAQKNDQGAQGQPQPGYQQQYPATSSPPNAGYALPQPSSSGSVDLSNIKPSSSGSLNLEDILSRARGPPPRETDSRSRGSYVRSRSRSRSPQRGGYRDGHNPYRDERRRDRSHSPRRTNSGQDDSVETITIDSNLVGLIIGRQGENLRRVESDTGARVQFITGPEHSGPHRQCKISGSRAARDHAKAEINRIIEENGREKGATSNLVPAPAKQGNHPNLRAGEESMQIMVPNRTVGLIIGRKGETIQDLQERSGCHVNIVGEDKSVNGLRPVNLIGPAHAAQIAKELIMEIVDSDNKNMAAGTGGIPNQSQVMRGEDKINDKMMVPSEAVGMIIGKGGETIKEMQMTTGCKINVSQPQGRDVEREIGLVGSRPAIEKAKAAIMDKVRAVEEKNRNNSRQDYQYNNNSGSNYQGQDSYGGQQSQAPAASAQSDDPYSAYGGYQNYLAMWYAALGQQGGQPPSQP